MFWITLVCSPAPVHLVLIPLHRTLHRSLSPTSPARRHRTSVALGPMQGCLQETSTTTVSCYTH
ncbi:hypothetical protein B0H17DRAFT_1113259 [Mycena rosella]|uniref:Uncharacterized protein n=1 Tax=Mycena rosella TaxID=1033263 RepID=A0AAD7BGS6_MYCRO|nr:hypothetical protein B0H17DRAFT_1113259 [Mycena rosella]